MFGIASRSKPSARTVSTQTWTDRSLGYVDSSGERRRSQRRGALVGNSGRSGVGARGHLGALGAEQPLEPALSQALERGGAGVRRPAEHSLELAQRDLLLGLAAGDGVALARELALEVVAGYE